MPDLPLWKELSLAVSAHRKRLMSLQSARRERTEFFTERPTLRQQERADAARKHLSPLGGSAIERIK
jgi:hypothetical protein